MSTEIRKDKTAPMIHFTLTSPQGVTELLSKFEKVGDTDYTGDLNYRFEFTIWNVRTTSRYTSMFIPWFLGEWKVNTPVGFLTADARINLESVDNFFININFDSDKLKERKIHAEIANKPTAKTGRRIIITVTSDGKNLVTGRYLWSHYLLLLIITKII